MRVWEALWKAPCRSIVWHCMAMSGTVWHCLGLSGIVRHCLGGLGGCWQPWEAAVDASEAPHVRWFCGARTNAAFNEIDRHVLRGHGEEVAFIAESPSGETTRITRRWLLLHSILIAHALQNGLHITAPQRIALCRWRVKRRLLQK